MKQQKSLISLLLALCFALAVMPVAASAETAEGECVYFGNQKWIELSDSKLLAIDVVDSIPHTASGLSNDWESSDAKIWCDSYDAFAAGEKAVLDGGVSFLTKEEAEQLPVDVLKASSGWWLSTPHEDAQFAYAVSDIGLIGSPHVAKNYGARPVIALDSSKVIMKSPVAKNDVLDVVGTNESKEWKYTVQSDAYSAFAVSDITLNNRTVSVTFSGAAVGEKDQVSAYIKNTAGNVLAYGSISKGVAADTVTFEVPETISGNLTVGVFNEQVNGGTATDYASAVASKSVVAADAYGYVDEWNISLKDDITVKFKMVINTTDENANVQITVNGDITTVPVSEVKANDNIASVDMAAAQMTDNIAVQVINSNGQGGAVQNYTIRGYADYILENSTNESEIELVKAMLNYGGKSQIYFDYNTDNLANDGITVTETAPGNDGLNPAVENSVDGISFYGASLLAESKTKVRFYFKADTVEGFTFQCGDVQLQPVEKTEGLYYVTVEGVSPLAYEDTITVTVNDTLSVSYSPMMYIQRMYHKATSSNALKEFVQAMHTYSVAAGNYTA